MEIVNASGEKENYERGKFCASLKTAGAPEDLVDEACALIEKDLKSNASTSEIFRKASQYLLKKNPGVGFRYNVKKGIMGLGPAGFQFEQFVEALVRSLGYETERNIIMQGICVSHEVDVVARKGEEHFLMEMKYGNNAGVKTGIEVLMYAHARLLDIAPAQEKLEKKGEKHSMWLVTNAKFTSKAIDYGKCQKIKMTGWSYPDGEDNLESLIRKNMLYPVTVLPSVDRFAREAFAREGMILAQDILPYSPRDIEKNFSIDSKKAESIIHEANLLVDVPLR